MNRELIYYSFDCLECLYSAGAFEPLYPIEQKLNHIEESNHINGKFKVKHMGVCLIK